MDRLPTAVHKWWHANDVFSLHAVIRKDPVQVKESHSSYVSTSWLAEHLDDADVVVLDASYKLPGVIPTAAEDYALHHIPGARFFDIDAVADQASRLPHMLPSADEFAEYAGRRGISNDSLVIVYDSPGLMSAARAWWTFRAFGHRRIAILDGGLRKWRAEGRPVTADIQDPPRAIFRAEFERQAVRNKVDVLDNLSTRAEQIIDARSIARFSGAEAEARPGLRPGHIPGSLNLPFTSMSDPETGELRSPDYIRAQFRTAGLDFERPVIATCGSGVTACALVFGLHLLGKSDVAVYDGSWAEWGQPGETPVEYE